MLDLSVTETNLDPVAAARRSANPRIRQLVHPQGQQPKVAEQQLSRLLEVAREWKGFRLPSRLVEHQQTEG